MNATRLPPLILGLPAMGVPASFYVRFADALGAATGADVEFADLPGQGERPERTRDGADFGYREIVEEELPDWVARRRAEHPGRPILLLGHSLGGQLALLASATLAARIDGLVLIAAGTAHWRVWPAGQRGRAWATVQVIRAVSALWPWYPGHLLGFGGDQPRRLMRDWGHNATTGRYQLGGSTRDVGVHVETEGRQPRRHRRIILDRIAEIIGLLVRAETGEDEAAEATDRGCGRSADLTGVIDDEIIADVAGIDDYRAQSGNRRASSHHCCNCSHFHTTHHNTYPEITSAPVS